MLTRLIVALTFAVGLLTVPVGAASSKSPDCERVDRNGRCTIRIDPPSTPSIKPVGGGGGTGGGRAPTCAEYGVPIPCSSEAFGNYSNHLQCYLHLRDPQPPPDSPLWEGNYPEGAVYQCLSAFSYPGTIAGGSVWLPGPPDGGLTPEAAAQAVVRRMDLRPPGIGIVPE